MKFAKKTMAILITLILMLTIVTFALPDAGAAALNIETYAFVSVRPNPVGVGQDLLVVMWLSNVPTTEYSAPQYQGEERQWHNLTITITKPDGTTIHKGPFGSGSAGTTFTTFVPDVVGTYYFQTVFLGETTQRGNYMKPSQSAKVSITVQQDPVPLWPTAALPAGYWERPISSDLREWSAIAGNWLMTAYNQSVLRGFSSSGFGVLAPYTKAPNSAHILWTKTLVGGGIVGGEAGTMSAPLGGTMAGLTPPIIMQGKLYYNLHIGTTGMPVAGLAVTLGGFACADLRTGEILWSKTEGNLDAGELRMESGGAVTPYLWEFGSTTYKLYHPTTGKLIRTFTNATNTSAWPLLGSRGEILNYMLDGQRNRLVLWNSSRTSGSPGTSAWSTGIQWNISIQDVPGTPATRYVKENDILLAEVSDFADRGNAANTEPTLFTHLAYSLKPGDEGRLLWAQNRTDIGDFATRGLSGSSMPAMNDGVYSIFERETLQNIVYDYRTGDFLWRADSINATSDPWSMYKSGSLIAYGKLYYSGYGGRVFAYDIKTGEKLWEYFDGTAGYQTPYNDFPYYGGFTFADGKIFIGNCEHSPTQPLWTGAKLHVIDAETGQGVWNVTGMFQSSGFAIADGYFIGFNAYDGQIYCFGKGKTATTVTASSKVSQHGDTILLEGTVTDQSPDSNAKGTPAISDADMTSWMEYLHMQKPRPIDASGVNVSLDTIDPNNNYVHIGNVTSDSNGLYKLMWTPEIPGEYTVTATFTGSESYWSSVAETAIGVTEVEPTPGPTLTPPSISETYFVPAIAGIIVAIAIVGALLAILMLRKRP